ncbi:MAG: diguanylate cyclase [Bacilli bacterium]|nr:diguanylate cyclase [Bacilli bacterium]MBN2876782.1 diguanylate cyclase [Bacilli bacterium]
MNIFLWILFIAITFIAFFPMSFLKTFDISKRYAYFKYVSILLFVWTIHTWLRLVANDGVLQYYLSLNLYPMVFLVVGTFFIAINNFIERPIHRITKWLLGGLFLIDLLVANTNALTQWMIQIAPSSTIQYFDMVEAPIGVFFYIHTFACYGMIAAIGVILIIHFYRGLKTDRDLFPFLFILLGMVVGIALNVVHIFFYTFHVDPTYITFVVLISIFYFVVYIRDIKLILLMNRNDFILDNLREMYVVVNQHNEIIDASEEFEESFELQVEEHPMFEDWLLEVQDLAVIFTDPKDLKMIFDPNKKYLHMQMKVIRIPLFKYTGKFYLFYDETEHQQFINDMNYVKSHDLMTGLYNRNHFEEIKPDIDDRNQSYALMLFDLDGLKLYNDYLGHSAGDNLVKHFAQRLQKAADEFKFTAIRMGGDEFLLLAMNMNIKMIEARLEEIIKVLNVPDGGDSILYSYGYAERESHSENLERVISRADQMMYQMKVENKEAKSKLLAKLKETSIKKKKTKKQP